MKHFKDCYGILVLNQTELKQSDKQPSEARIKKQFSFLRTFKCVLDLINKRPKNHFIDLKG